MIVAGLIILSLILAIASLAVFLFGAGLVDQEEAMEAFHSFYEERDQ